VFEGVKVSVGVRVSVGVFVKVGVKDGVEVFVNVGVGVGGRQLAVACKVTEMRWDVVYWTVTVASPTALKEICCPELSWIE